MSRLVQLRPNEPSRTLPRRPHGRIPATSCIVVSSRALSRPAQFSLARSGYARSGPTSSRCPYGHIPAVPHLAQSSHAGGGPVVSRSASPRRPCGRIPALPRLAASCRAGGCPAGLRRAKPHRATPVRALSPLKGVSLPGLARPRCAPLRSRFATSRLAKPSPATIGPVLFALTGVSLSRHADVSRVKPRSADECRAWSCLVHPGPARSCSPLWGVSLPCSVKPRHVTPSRVSSCLVVPVRSTPCPDKQNPEHLRSRDLLKVHGGCTDVRDSTHERATKQPPSREPSAVSVYHSRVVPVNRG